MSSRRNRIRRGLGQALRGIAIAATAIVVVAAIVVAAPKIIAVGTVAMIASTVIAAGATGVGLYGLSEMHEGLHDAYLGIRDIDDSERRAFNPLRDTVFGGNQRNYNRFYLFNLGMAAVGGAVLLPNLAYYAWMQNSALIAGFPRSSPPPPPSELIIRNAQLGDKWRTHRFDYPNLSDHVAYRELAHDIFRRHDRMVYDAWYNEFYFIRGLDVLRVLVDGVFVSLYPGANSPRVMDAINALLRR